METYDEFRARILADWGEGDGTPTPPTCRNCHCLFEETDEIHERNGFKYCDDCFSELFFTCPECGDTEPRLHMVHIESEETDICSSCFSRHFCTCDFCSEPFRTNDMHHLHGYDLCDVCFDDSIICTSCGTPIREGNEHVDNDGDCYCDSCYEERNMHVRSWNYKKTPIFHPASATTGYGVELEIDGGADQNDCAQELKEISNGEKLFYMKHDGSLGCEGFEVVTHPCTLEYHCNEFPWQAISDIAKSNNYKSHKTSTCGLHVHASREMFGEDRVHQDLSIAKIMLLFDMFWDSHIVPFSRRNFREIDQWAKKPSRNFQKSDGEAAVIYKANDDNGSRYQSVNLCNARTVEFRIFRGTLKVSTIKATLQWLDEIIAYAIKTDLSDIWNTNWEDIFKDTIHEELRAYMINKKILEGD